MAVWMSSMMRHKLGWPKKTLSEDCTEAPWKMSGNRIWAMQNASSEVTPNKLPTAVKLWHCQALWAFCQCLMIWWFTLCILACRLQGALMPISSIYLKWDSCKCTVLSLWFVQLLPSTMSLIGEHQIAHLLVCTSFLCTFLLFLKREVSIR